MKKWLVVVLSLIMLCVSSALAEPFTFSNGVQWGMSKEEVIGLQNGDGTYEYDVNYNNNVELIGFSNRKLSKFKVDRGYLFTDDSLFSCYYLNFSSSTDADYNYLKGALTSVYGDSENLDAETVNAFLTGIEGADKYNISKCVAWNLSDTNIWLFMVDSEITLFYIDASFDASQIGVYDTTGL